jgi:site-specific recombinase XerD
MTTTTATRVLAKGATSPFISELAAPFRLSLEAQNKRPKTIRAYLDPIRLLDDYLHDHGMPRRVGAIHREHVEAFIADQLVRYKPATANNRYRGLQAFFRWAVEDDAIEISPMANMKPPTVPEQPVPVISDDDIRSLLRACEGKTFRDLRDTAIVRLLIDTGMRRSELATLAVDDIDLVSKQALAQAKGGGHRVVPFGLKTAQSLDRYMRKARASHRGAALPDLWLGHAGQMTSNGIYQAVIERSRTEPVKPSETLRSRNH